MAPSRGVLTEDRRWGGLGVGGRAGSHARRELLSLLKLLVHGQRQGPEKALNGDSGGLENTRHCGSPCPWGGGGLVAPTSRAQAL